MLPWRFFCSVETGESPELSTMVDAKRSGARGLDTGFDFDFESEQGLTGEEISSRNGVLGNELCSRGSAVNLALF